MIVLFHQGGGDARGEYADIIPRLLAERFHVLSVDVRGGGTRFGSGHRAPETQPGFRYCQAFEDVATGVQLARASGLAGRVVLWGSSYTATLVLQLAATDTANVAGVLAFSPAAGELLSECEPVASARTLRRAGIPTMLLRSTAELASPDARARHEALAELATRSFMAEGSGHGSSLLVASRFQGDVAPQWQAVLEFLRQLRSERR